MKAFTRIFALAFTLFLIPACVPLDSIYTSQTAPQVTRVPDEKKELPSQFIALSEREMTWDEAKAFCRQQGGRLPLIGGRNSLAGGMLPSGTPIDGFGSWGAPWPSGLPSATYWAGTERTGDPDVSFVVADWHGKVGNNYAHQFRGSKVVCVRQ